MDNIEQGSADWFAARLGKITASRVADVLATGRAGAESLTRKKYRNELIRERLTGKRLEGYTNAAMERGTLLEPIARAAYEIKHNVFVEQVSFVNHPVIQNAGASPDGLIDIDGLLEIKCPNPETHIDYLLSEGQTLRARYFDQVQFQLAVTNRFYCHLISFDPDMIDELQLCLVEIQRDNEYIANMEAEIIKFDNEITETILKLKEGK